MAEEPAAVVDPIAATPALVDGTKTQGSESVAPFDGATRPEWLDQVDPDKKFASYDAFKADYDLARGRQETDEERTTREAAEAAAPKDDAATVEEAKPATLAEAKPEAIEAVKTSLKEAGGLYADPRYLDAAVEFEVLGKVTPETMKSTAEAFGVPEAAVQQFIDGQVAQRELVASKVGQPSPELVKLGEAVLKVMPDEAQYRAFMEWGETGLTASEKAAYDKALDASDADTAGALLAGFNARYQAAGNGPGPRDVSSEAAQADGGTQAVQPYTTAADMHRDQAKPEYEKDAAFRATVARRAAASKW